MFEKYYGELISYFSGFLKDKDYAHDVVHECYSRVLARSSCETPVKEFRAYLFRTVRNIIINDNRKNARYRHVDIDSIPVVDVPSEQPSERLESKERIDKLILAIDSLPPRCHEAFVLYKFEGLSQALIAHKMGISQNMVEKHIMKAMKICKRCLKDLEE